MMINRKSAGFSFVEILVVLTILGFIAAFIGPRITKYIAKSEEAKMKLKMSSIKEALNEYRLELGMYPSSREGLSALVENPRPNDERFKKARNKWPFIGADMIQDAQGNDLIYHCPPEDFKGKYKHFEIIYQDANGDEDSRIDDGI